MILKTTQSKKKNTRNGRLLMWFDVFSGVSQQRYLSPTHQKQPLEAIRKD